MKPVPLLILPACLALLAACSSVRVEGDGLLIPEPNTESHHVTITRVSGLSAGMRGMEVTTVGTDTVVTHHHRDGARRFVLQGLTGYRGRIRLETVDVVVGGVAVWLSGERFKAHGPGVSIDIPLLDESGEDRFGGGDLILGDGVLRPIGTGGS